MRVLVTAGGTREPIDSARVIANTSTGRLGVEIARAAGSAGHRVLLLRAASGAAAPPGVESAAFETSAELSALLERHVPQADAVFHAAAVSDYVPERASGKLPSDAPELHLRLVRAPKLIDGLRAAAPAALLVGFKLTAGQDESARRATALALLRRAQLDLVVVNEAGQVGEHDHEALLVAESGPAERAVGKAAIAAALVAWLQRARQARTAPPASTPEGGVCA